MDKDQSTITLTEIFPYEIETVFNYWSQPKLLERWAYPDGMTLKVTNSENIKGGTYQMEHTGKEGKYICIGKLLDIIPNQRLHQLETITGPNGKVLYENLECITEFKETKEGTEVTIIQTGFADQKSADECLQGWTQSFEKLDRLLDLEESVTSFSSYDDGQPTL